jgi:hypothetical protein
MRLLTDLLMVNIKNYQNNIKRSNNSITLLRIWK